MAQRGEIPGVSRRWDIARVFHDLSAGNDRADTNVVADLVRPRPDGNVTAWFEDVPNVALHIEGIE